MLKLFNICLILFDDDFNLTKSENYFKTLEYV